MEIYHIFFIFLFLFAQICTFSVEIKKSRKIRQNSASNSQNFISLALENGLIDPESKNLRIFS